ncbi:hypothetical protein SBA4_3390013 [Candidatus Sulfopaludibacter sp. SbA4]|nr:hypothetical protein SBA4_3390013 [Candidatus Sulfopaludibacter sp. SbA4]
MDIHVYPSQAEADGKGAVYRGLLDGGSSEENRGLRLAFAAVAVLVWVRVRSGLSPRLPFWYGSGSDPDPVAQAVYERMQSIGEKAGIADCRPHRLRDTFAVRRLLSGKLHLEDVSRLLGHSSVKVTETYYAKWVTSRKRRLERLVSESLMDS